ncbi:hypothetical protein JCM10207_009002 [Rhodosporidiobolus poonsookiae]
MQVTAALLGLSALSLAVPPTAALPVTPIRVGSTCTVAKRAASCGQPSVTASATYGGTNSSMNGTEVRLRISNGGAGQSGLVGALAQAYIDYSVENGLADEPYLIDWVTGDTTYSIDYLQSGDADIGITYNAQAEYRALNLSIASKRIYGFRDHFLIAGPKNNTANLTDSDGALDIFNKLVTTGDSGNGTLFLSRFDKSATNIKESNLFTTIGQVPWALTYSKWYFQYPQFPIQALSAASLLQAYTLSDRGTLLTLQSQEPTLVDNLVIYKRGEDDDPEDLLLNPAAVLLGSNICPDNQALAEGFMDWMASADGGQAVVSSYTQPGSTEILYTAAPNCTTQPDHCLGW